MGLRGEAAIAGFFNSLRPDSLPANLSSSSSSGPGWLRPRSPTQVWMSTRWTAW